MGVLKGKVTFSNFGHYRYRPIPPPAVTSAPSCCSLLEAVLPLHPQ